MAGDLNLYDVTIAMFTRSLKNLDAILTKAEEHAKANSVDLNEYTEGRLAPDMFTLVKQVQTACNSSKFTAVRVVGITNVPHEDDEKTFEELHARIASTLDFLSKVKREDFDDKAGSEVTFRDMKFTGVTYCTGFAIPNFFFHVVTAYDILRNKGVPVGKFDFLGRE